MLVLRGVRSADDWIRPPWPLLPVPSAAGRRSAVETLHLRGVSGEQTECVFISICSPETRECGGLTCSSRHRLVEDSRRFQNQTTGFCVFSFVASHLCDEATELKCCVRKLLVFLLNLYIGLLKSNITLLK